MSSPLSSHASAGVDRRALIFMLLGAAIIGTNGLLVRLAGTPPTVSAFWRMLIAGLLLLIYARATGRWRPLPARAWWWAMVPAVAFAADLWLWHRSILIVGPGLSTLLANAQVFFMALAGVLLFGERLGPRFIGGLGFACFGLWLMLGGHWDTLPAEYRWGVWLGLGTGVCYAVYNLGLRRAQHEADRDPAHRAPIEQLLGIASLGSAVFLGLAGAVEGDDFTIATWHAFGILLALAAIGHCVSWVLISRAMKHLRVAVIGLLLLLQPIVAFVLDVWMFDRVTSPRECLGLAFTLAGIFLASVRGRRAAPDIAQ